jgi:methylase of polypeptide subunit release factors
MEELILERGKIFYEKEYDGGGSVFGINALKDPNISKHIKKGKILEMCSGPGFMGVFLKLEGYADELTLADINAYNRRAIYNTISENNLDNVEFIHSDVFLSINGDQIFDTIVSNPPHFKSPKTGGYKNIIEQYISLDKNMELHKTFFKQVVNHIHNESKIILVENCEGVTGDDIIEMALDKFDIEITEPNKFGWEGKSNYYAAILQLKK